MTIPRILIAGTQSGSGKTTLTLGLICALRRRGLKVQTFKVGPDYLDPTWLAAASGRPCYNLDGWMCGRDYVEQLFNRTTGDADLAVIEGVMGLFDGAQASGVAGSSAEIAQWLKAPVVLVVNAHGMGRSIAALAAGFAGFQEGVHIRGVIANQCGSENHGAILRESLASAGGPALAGAVPRKAFPELRSRHLGLVTADPIRNCHPSVLEEFVDVIERFVDLDQVLTIARAAPKFLPDSSSLACNETLPDHSLRLAVALDEVFHFYYEDLFDELRLRGCCPVFFSPLRDGCLPDDVDALYLGGGYPEEYAEILAANCGMLDSIRRFVRSGMPVYAECGGLIYLSQAITTRNGRRHPMLGILPAETRMLDRRKRLGYVEVALKEDSLWGNAGERICGHEFHYSEIIPNITALEGWSFAYDLKTGRGAYDSPEGFYLQRGPILASYVHLYLASRPSALDHFINVCCRAESKRPWQSSGKEIRI